MIKQVLPVLLLLVPLLLPAQRSFTLRGKVNALKSGDKIYLVYQVEDQQITDSVLVQNGHFELKGPRIRRISQIRVARLVNERF